MKLLTIGVISDTHNLLREEALAALEGSDYIIHAGDVGERAIVDQLSALAPLSVVRGNVDREGWAQQVPTRQVLEVGEVSIYILHNLAELDLRPERAGFAAVVFGHSHQPEQELRQGVLYFNPGSAGPKRFRLPVTVGRLTVSGGRICSEIIRLKC
jgi:putative phosphoesterase